MRNIIFTIVFILTFSIVSSSMNIISAAGVEDRLIVSPSFNIIEFTEEESIDQTITVRNAYDRTVTVKATPVIIRIVNNDAPQIIESSELIENINVPISSIDLLPDNTYEFDIQVSNPLVFQNGFYPGLQIEPINEIDSEDPVNIGSTIISTLILESSTSNFGFDIDLNIDQIEIFGNQVKITGEVINNGRRSFSPTGSIITSKDEKRLDNFEITSQINKLILPGQSVEFVREFEVDNQDLNFLNKVGNYDLTVNVNPNPYQNNITKTSSIFIFPTEQLISFISIILITLLLSIIIGRSVMSKNKRNA